VGSISSNSLKHKGVFARRACISGGLAGRAGVGGKGVILVMECLWPPETLHGGGDGDDLLGAHLALVPAGSHFGARLGCLCQW
jgi:hypothetical protein